MAENERIDESHWRKVFEETPTKNWPDHSTILCTRHSVEKLMLRFRLIADELKMCGGRVIDVGCGLGNYSRYLDSRGCDVVAVDYSHNMALASKRKDAYGRIAHAQAEAYSLPFRDASFDAMLCIEVLQLVNREDAALNEAARVLRPSGVMILSTLNRLKIREYLTPIVQTLFRAKDAERQSWKRYNPFELKRQVIRAGFNDVRLLAVITMPKSLRLIERILYLPEAIRIVDKMPLFLIFAHSFFVIARRK